MFQFLPTANTIEFDAVPEIKAAWHELINYFFELNIQGRPDDQSISSVEELKLWGRSENDLRFYNPASTPVPPGSEPANVTWSALPTSFDERFGADERAKFEYLDQPQFDTRVGRFSRVQDEYNEWQVIRNGSDRITRVIFTSEPPEFYRFLYEDWFGIGTDKTHSVLLQLYRDRCDDADIRIEDLGRPGNAARYNSFNRWNNEFCVHMQQVNNALGAQVNIAAISAVLRMHVEDGTPITDALPLIRCGQFGAEARQSDPSIGAAVNRGIASG